MPVIMWAKRWAGLRCMTGSVGDLRGASQATALAAAVHCTAFPALFTLMKIVPLWRRLAAIVYDSVLLTAIWIVMAFLVTAAFGIEQSRHIEGEQVIFDPVYQYTLFATMLATAYLFFGWFWTHSGQTLGMQAWKIKVENPDGSTVSWRQVALRCVTAPFALAIFGLGYLWMILDPYGRSWPDLASGSIIVRLDNFPPKRPDTQA